MLEPPEGNNQGRLSPCVPQEVSSRATMADVHTLIDRNLRFADVTDGHVREIVAPASLRKGDGP